MFRRRERHNSSPERKIRRSSPFQSRGQSSSFHSSRSRSQYDVKRRDTPPRHLRRSRSSQDRSPARFRRENRSSPERWGHNSSRRSRSPRHFSRTDYSSSHFSRRSPQYGSDRRKSPTYFPPTDPANYSVTKGDALPPFYGRSRTPERNFRDDQDAPRHVLERAKFSPPPFRRAQSPEFRYSGNQQGEGNAQQLFSRRGATPERYSRNEQGSSQHILEREKFAQPFSRRNQSPEFRYSGNEQGGRSSFDTFERGGSSSQFFAKADGSSEYYPKKNVEFAPMNTSQERYSPTEAFERQEPPANLMERNGSSQGLFVQTYVKSSTGFSKELDKGGDRGGLYSEPASSWMDPPSNAWLDHSPDSSAEDQEMFDRSDIEESNQDNGNFDGTTRSPPYSNFIRNRSIKSLAQINSFNEQQILGIYVSKKGHKRILALMEQGCSHVEAKRTVLKQNFVQLFNRRKNEFRRRERVNPPNRPGVSASVPQGSTISPFQSAQIPDGPEKIRVGPVDYPKVKLSRKQTTEVHSALLSVYMNVPDYVPQPRFGKIKLLKSGALLITCLDKASADWLKNAVAQLRLPMGVQLTTQSEGAPANLVDRVLQKLEPKVQKTDKGQNNDGHYFKCTTFIRDQLDGTLQIKQILHRLDVSNKGLNAQTWKTIVVKQAREGRLCLFIMNRDSLDVVGSLDMRPYFGFDRLKFKFKGEVYDPWKFDKTLKGPESNRQ